MKLIAGSILAGFGLLVTALAHSPELYPNLGFGFHPIDFPTPVEVLAILFIAGGIGLIGWAIWGMVTKKE